MLLLIVAACHGPLAVTDAFKRRLLCYFRPNFGARYFERFACSQTYCAHVFGGLSVCGFCSSSSCWSKSALLCVSWCHVSVFQNSFCKD